MRTETLAIVFTDIQGYTAATSAQTHQENARMLRRMERLIAPVVRAYAGRVIKSIGDAYMIVFRSPTEAVHCATAIQDHLHLHNQSAGDGNAMHIRIAMNVGEVRVHRGDVFGEPVNIAARIESITPADEIYFSSSIYLTMNRTNLPCERVGDFDLKGLPEPVTVYRIKKTVAPVQEGASPAAQGGDATVATTPEGEAERKAAAGRAAPAPLPFGGTQLVHWRRMRWLRRAYLAVWLTALAGLSGAAYLRYRPKADYTSTIEQAKRFLDEGKAMDCLAAAGQIPPDAVQERSQARRVRRRAVVLLIQENSLEVAATELNALLAEDNRDPEALLLRGMLLAKRDKDAKAAMTDIAAALRMNESLAERPEVMAAVVQGYRDPVARRTSERLIEVYLKQNAVPALVQALGDPTIDLKARKLVGLRLEKLGAAEEVDWVALALEELRSPDCTTRKNSIERLVRLADERAVGPLIKVADGKSCGAAQARKAVDTILGK